MGRTVGKGAAEGKALLPVRVEGYRRLFNFAPPHYTPSRTIRQEPLERAAANVEKAEGFSFNGLAFEADPEEMEALDRREGCYDRVVVPLWHFGSDGSAGEGAIYVCPPDAEWIERDLSLLLPHWRDVLYARVGAYRVGEAFGREYDRSTYMADGETLVADFYAEHLEGLSRLAPPWTG
jgi:hypothetical protein